MRRPVMFSALPKLLSDMVENGETPCSHGISHRGLQRSMGGYHEGALGGPMGLAKG